MKNKFTALTMLGLGIITITLLSVSYVSAQNSDNYPPIVQKIADRFGLNESEVQEVFDEEHGEHFTNMQVKWQERLDDLLSDGKITADQKMAIIAKHEEMHNQMLELQSLSMEERHEKMEAIHEEFQNWTDELGLKFPLSNFGLMGNEFHMRFGRGMHSFRTGI